MAVLLIKESVAGRLELVSLSHAHYRDAIADVARRGLTSGIVYDALHVSAAVQASCSRIYTKNLEHFRSICPDQIIVSILDRWFPRQPNKAKRYAATLMA